MTKRHRTALFLGLALALLFVAGCAPGNERFISGPAGFWAGLWHGLIFIVTFIISLFTDSVRMYEVSNTGGWYDFGFLLGAVIILSSNSARKPMRRKGRVRCGQPREWDDIGTKVEEKVRRAIRSWVEESEGEEDDWEDIGRKIEEKIKRELRNWAEK